MTSPSSMHETGHSKPVHWDNLEGRDGMGRDVEGGFEMRNTCTPVTNPCQCMAKTTIIL